MNIRSALSNTIKKLKEKNIKTADLDALILLSQAIKKNDVFIISNPEYELTNKETEKLDELTKKRQNFYPISYIKKSKEFYSFDFFINEDVLIPRPETEMLVEEIISLSKQFREPFVVDVGTGSGCIAISIAKSTNAFVVASDISQKTLSVAKYNADKLKADVEFVCADTLSFLSKKVDIIVSNPPYIKVSKYDNLQEDVKFEPKSALLCKNGTDIIEKLINEAKNLCVYLILEIGENHKEFVESFSSCLYVKNDLAGLPRMAVFKFSN